MPETIVYISHFKIKEGKHDSLLEMSRQVTEQIKKTKPGTVAFLQFTNDEGTELSIIHVFLDEDSFDHHVEGVTERAKASMEHIEPTRREVYGMPSDKVLEMLSPSSESGIEFQIIPKTTGGYIRIDP